MWSSGWRKLGYPLGLRLGGCFPILWVLGLFLSLAICRSRGGVDLWLLEVQFLDCRLQSSNLFMLRGGALPLLYLDHPFVLVGCFQHESLLRCVSTVMVGDLFLLDVPYKLSVWD
jgi:hypothetical protein